jgi:hypothetical protein
MQPRLDKRARQSQSSTVTQIANKDARDDIVDLGGGGTVDSD